MIRSLESGILVENESSAAGRNVSASDLPPGDGDEARDPDVAAFFSTPADQLLNRAKTAPEPERRRLVEEALSVDPKHVAARIRHAEYAGSREATYALLQAVAEEARNDLEAALKVDDAERRLRTHFDFVLSHMRLGFAQWGLGLLDQAAETFESMLVADAKDSLRCRNGLLACRLEMQQFDRAVALMDRFPDQTAVWRYGRALTALVERPNSVATQAILAHAAEHSPLAGTLLLLDDQERWKRVDEMQASIDAAQADPKEAAAAKRDLAEADKAANLLCGAWTQHPGVLNRLAEAVLAPAARLPRLLRSRPALPAARTDEWRAKILAVPQTPAEVWRIEVRRIDCWLPQGQSLARGWLTGVWNAAAEDFRSFLLDAGEPSAERILAAFTEAALDPRGSGAPQPGRPAQVEFSPFPGLAEIVDDLRSVGIERTPQDGPTSPEALAMIEDGMRKASIPRPPALARTEGLSAGGRKSFYKAAERFAKAAPWKKLLRNDVLEIAKVGGGTGWRKGVNMVSGGAATASVRMVDVIARFAPIAPALPSEKFTIEFVEFSKIAVADYDDVVETHGMTFPDGLWPKTRVEGTLREERPPSEIELEAATVALQASVLFAEKVGAARRKPFKVQVEYDGRTIEATATPISG